MPDYLIKQRQGWYAVLEIPKDVRAALGKNRIKQTLKTDYLSEARPDRDQSQIEPPRGRSQGTARRHGGNSCADISRIWLVKGHSAMGQDYTRPCGPYQRATCVGSLQAGGYISQLVR